MGTRRVHVFPCVDVKAPRAIDAWEAPTPRAGRRWWSASLPSHPIALPSYGVVIVRGVARDSRSIAGAMTKGAVHFTVGAIFGLSLLHAGDGHAQGAATRCAGAATAIEIALREREAGRTGPALAVLEDLHARCPTPQVRAQLALAETDAGRLLHAWRHLTDALAAENDPWIRTRRAALLVARTELRARMASLAVRGTPPGASLRVDGELLGDAAASEPWVVGVGVLHVELRAPGFRTIQRDVTTTAGQSLSLDMPMVADTPQPAAAPTVAPTSRLARTPEAPTARYVGYALVGVGAAAAVTGAVFAVLEHRVEDGLAEYEHAVALDPSSSDAHDFMTMGLTSLGREAEAKAAASRARELDPLSARIEENMAFTEFQFRHYERSIELYRKLLDREPFYFLASLGLAWNYIMLDRPAEAVREVERVRGYLGDQPFCAGTYAYALARAGRTEDARAVLDSLAGAPESVVAYEQALSWTGLGDISAAIDWLERAKAQRIGWMVFARVNPLLDALRNNPRFDALAELNVTRG